MEDRLRKETGSAPIAPTKFYSFTDAEENTRELFSSGDSCTTFTPVGSAKCSRTPWPPLDSAPA
jgi:hypothetical protein